MSIGIDTKNFLCYDYKVIELIEHILKLKELAIEKHYYCEDSWYSCPKAEDGCANEWIEKDECNCGADEHNEKVEELFKEIVNECRKNSSKLEE